MEGGMDTPIPAAATPVEIAAAAAMGAVTEMTNRPTLDGGDASNGRPLELEDAGRQRLQVQGMPHAPRPRRRHHLRDQITTYREVMMTRSTDGTTTVLRTYRSSRR
ncbi:hypothetical protein SEVIR_9G127950v4 [Setaria viridis]